MGTHWNDGTETVYEKTKAICSKWNIPFFDMRHSGGINMAVSSQYDTFKFADGAATHPNDEGYRCFYVPKLTALLKSCCPYYE